MKHLWSVLTATEVLGSVSNHGIDAKKVEESIASAEQSTSGEIRVHIEARCPEEVLDRAAFIFSQLDMHRTDQRNGVLIYLSYTDRKFAIIGDAGINKKVEPGFWDSTAAIMRESFAKDDLTNGLCMGLKEAGEQLKRHFPRSLNDENELSNLISFGPTS